MFGMSYANVLFEGGALSHAPCDPHMDQVRTTPCWDPGETQQSYTQVGNEARTEEEALTRGSTEESGLTLHNTKMSMENILLLNNIMFRNTK